MKIVAKFTFNGSLVVSAPRPGARLSDFSRLAVDLGGQFVPGCGWLFTHPNQAVLPALQNAGFRL